MQKRDYLFLIDPGEGSRGKISKETDCQEYRKLIGLAQRTLARGKVRRGGKGILKAEKKSRRAHESLLTRGGAPMKESLPRSAG